MFIKFIKRVIIYIYVRLLKVRRAISENLLGSKISRVIILDAPYKFHFQHLSPLLDALRNDERINLIVTKWQGFEETDAIPGVTYLEHEELDKKKFDLYDCFITTEYRRMFWWFHGNINTGFLLHGVGPKASYIKDRELNEFTFILSPGPEIFAIQNSIVTRKQIIKKTGLPVTDRLFNKPEASKDRAKYFDNDLPVILYAPSWSSNPDMISMDDAILVALHNQKICNVIIRPHPLLLNPEKCGGIDFSAKLISLRNPYFLVDTDIKKSIYCFFDITNILLSDISSVLYEFMLLNRPICIYKKPELDAMYKYIDKYDELTNAVTTIEDPKNLEDTLLRILDNPNKLSQERGEVIKHTFFNPGKATQATIDEIYNQANLSKS